MAGLLEDSFTLLVVHLDARSLWQLLTCTQGQLSIEHGPDVVGMLCTQLATSAAVCSHRTHVTSGLAATARRYLEIAARSRWLSPNYVCRVLGKYSRGFVPQCEDDGFNLGTGRDFKFYDSLTLVSDRVLVAYYGYYQSFSAFDLSSGALLDVDEHTSTSVGVYAGLGNLLACSTESHQPGIFDRLLLWRQVGWPVEREAQMHSDAELLSFDLHDHESFEEHRFSAVALNDFALVAVSQYRHGLFRDAEDVAAHAAVHDSVQAHVWKLEHGQPAQRVSLTLWEASQAELAHHAIVRHVSLVDTYLIVLGEEAEDGSEWAAQDGWESGRTILQVWELARGHKLFEQYGDHIGVHAFSVVGEQVPGCGCCLYIAAGGTFGQMLLCQCETWQYDDVGNVGGNDYEDRYSQFALREANELLASEFQELQEQIETADETGDTWATQQLLDKLEREPKLERETRITGVHWDSQKLLVAMGSMLVCKLIDADFDRIDGFVPDHAWSLSVGHTGRIVEFAASPRFVVLLTSFQGEHQRPNDQIAVLSVGDFPGLANGLGVAARGASALGYLSEGDSDDAGDVLGDSDSEMDIDDGEGNGEEGEEGDGEEG